MDIFSHGLWTAAAYKAVELKQKKHFKIWWAVFFSLAPDLFSFGILFATRLVTLRLFQPEFIDDKGLHPELVPQYVHILYNWTHSFLIFAAVFGLVWLFLKRPFWELGAWGLHIASDIFTHTDVFFPTPFLWPFSDYRASVISWADPHFMIPNYIALALVYGIFFFIIKRRKIW